jgi:pimeloyl-ACP methyl ester carboxylesterase
VIVAGTTNAYVAQEILASSGQAKNFDHKGFRRGMVVAPGFDLSAVKAQFAGDVVLTDGQWQKGKEIFDVVDDMQAGDVILKGANALDLSANAAAVLIAHPMGGTVAAATASVIGRRVKLIVPVGLEKRVTGPLIDIACELNDPTSEGPRMMILPGRPFTELDAINLLAGAQAKLVAGGGVYGAEGACWLAVEGNPRQLNDTADLITSIAKEPLCQP